MSQREIEALKKLDSGYDCARSVISAFLPALSLPEDQLERFSGSCCCFLGKPEVLCGAVTGAIQVIRMKLEGTPAEKETAETLIAQFQSDFQKHHGSLSCSELLGADLSTYRGRFEAMEKGTCETLCPVLVSDAVTLLEEELHLV